VASLDEHCAELVVADALDETRLAHRSGTAMPLHLADHPLEVLAARFVVRQRVDRVLDGDRSHALQPPPDLHTQVGRMGGKTVDQEQPGDRIGAHEPEDTADDTSVSMAKLFNPRFVTLRAPAAFSIGAARVRPEVSMKRCLSVVLALFVGA